MGGHFEDCFFGGVIVDAFSVVTEDYEFDTGEVGGTGY